MGNFNNDQRIRFAGALERVGYDDDLLASLAQIAAEDAPLLMTQLERDVVMSNLKAVAATGHALKGLLSTYETDSPIGELQLLIDAARAGEQVEVEKALAHQWPRLQELIGEIEKLAACTTT